GEGGIETFGRLLDVVNAVPGQGVADKGFVEFLTIRHKRRIGRVVVLDDLAFIAAEEGGVERAGDRHAEAQLATSRLRTVERGCGFVTDTVIGIKTSRHLETHEAGL